MDIKVYTEYWNGVTAECDLALEAVGKLNFAIMGLYRNSPREAQYRRLQDEVFQAIGCLLTAAGNLSCLIWPNEAKKRSESTGQINIMNDADHMEAAKYLRRRLRLDKRHILHNRWLKDCFAEKMVVERQTHNQETVFHVVGSYLPFSGHFMPTMVYLYDPISRKLQCGGATLDIQEIAAAIYSMKISLQEEYWKITKEASSERAVASVRMVACA
jgi:hypothetical protein